MATSALARAAVDAKQYDNELPDNILRLLRDFPLEDSDGISTTLFEYLWTEIEPGQGGAPVPIADTVILHDHALHKWYFWSPKELRIMKKATKNLTCRFVAESFSRGKHADFLSAYSVSYHGDPTNAQLEQRYYDKMELFKALDLDQKPSIYLEEVIQRGQAPLEEALRGPDATRSKHPSLPSDGLLQRFSLPRQHEHGDAPHNHLLRARWEKWEGFSLVRVSNKRPLFDAKSSRLSRVVTADSDDVRLVDAQPIVSPLDPVYVESERILNVIMTHVGKLTRGKKEMAFVELLLREEAKGGVVLLYATNVQFFRDSMFSQSSRGYASSSTRNQPPPRRTRLPQHVTQSIWDAPTPLAVATPVSMADAYACVQCGTVVATKHIRKVPFRELQRFYELVVSFERDAKVRTWLAAQIPPAILRSDHALSKQKYERFRKDASFLYKMGKVCPDCHHEIYRVTLASLKVEDKEDNVEEEEEVWHRGRERERTSGAKSSVRFQQQVAPSSISNRKASPRSRQTQQSPLHYASSPADVYSRPGSAASRASTSLPPLLESPRAAAQASAALALDPIVAARLVAKRHLEERVFQSSGVGLLKLEVRPDKKTMDEWLRPRRDGGASRRPSSSWFTTQEEEDEEDVDDGGGGGEGGDTEGKRDIMMVGARSSAPVHSSGASPRGRSEAGGRESSPVLGNARPLSTLGRPSFVPPPPLPQGATLPPLPRERPPPPQKLAVFFAGGRIQRPLEPGGEEGGALDKMALTDEQREALISRLYREPVAELRAKRAEEQDDESPSSLSPPLSPRRRSPSPPRPDPPSAQATERITRIYRPGVVPGSRAAPAPRRRVPPAPPGTLPPPAAVAAPPPPSSTQPSPLPAAHPPSSRHTTPHRKSPPPPKGMRPRHQKDYASISKTLHASPEFQGLAKKHAAAKPMRMDRQILTISDVFGDGKGPVTATGARGGTSHGNGEVYAEYSVDTAKVSLLHSSRQASVGDEVMVAAIEPVAALNMMLANQAMLQSVVAE